MTGAVLRAEWRKLWSGRAWWVFAVAAIVWCGYIAYSFGALEVNPPEGVPASDPDPAALTALVARQWFQMHLVTSLLAAMAVTREYSASTITRSVLLAGTRERLFAAKLVAALGMGVLYGLLAAVGGLASAWVVLGVLDVPPTASRELVTTLIGLLVISALAALWGSLLGWLFRHPVVTIVVLLITTLMIDPLLQTISAEAFSWTFSIVLSAIYLDGKDGLLSLPVAYLTAGAWLLAAGAGAAVLLRRRDVV